MPGMRGHLIRAVPAVAEGWCASSVEMVLAMLLGGLRSAEVRGLRGDVLIRHDRGLGPHARPAKGSGAGT